MASTSGSDSSVDRRMIGDSFARSQPTNVPHASQIWLDGEVLSCACPECGAPMSIRVWLSLAECRMCGAQVELTEEQERLARQLLADRESSKGPLPPAARTSLPVWANPVVRDAPQPNLRPVEILAPPPASPSPPAMPSKGATPPPVPRLVPPAIPKPLIAEVVDAPPRLLIARPADALPLPTPPEEEKPRLFGRGWLQHAIAALVSLIVNMMFIILLGLFQFQFPAKPDLVILEVDMKPAPAGAVGGEVFLKAPAKQPAVAEPKTNAPLQPNTSEKPQMLAAVTAIETKELIEKLRPAIEPAPLPLPSSASGGGSFAIGTLLAGRDQSVRAKVLNIEGGTERTEMAVAMGLKWIASHQNRDGSWSLDGFPTAGECRGRCEHIGLSSDTAGTALALLPFLGAGFTHRGEHEYRETVDKGLMWLVSHQEKDGDLRGPGGGRMYSHGQAAIALCEAYALTHDSKLREPAQKAIDFIVKAQHARGGWRYSPGEAGDTSVVGWQIMALRSAQMAKLNVPDAVLRKSDLFLASVQASTSQGRFSYMPGSHISEVMTAEGLLCRLYSGWRTNFPPLVNGVDWLLKSHLPTAENINMYYCYYATQVMHHIGGDRWKKWNERTRKVLVELQATEGHMAGSWAPMEIHDRVGGRLYMTALAVCTLEVYYRHLPLYKNAVTMQGK
ncbi:MAG: terpene cyclase/mutase family protein [Planctomycetia bacterium]|nr:terpene cyclase/mutase family protein [Planctomycetia bacterium]